MFTDKERFIADKIWQGFSLIKIAELLEYEGPMSAEHREALPSLIADVHTRIKKEVQRLPEVVEIALRKGFTPKEVFDTYQRLLPGVIAPWNLQVTIDGVAAKIAEEGERARETAEKQAAEAKRAAIQKQIEDAKATLRDKYGANL